MLLIHSEVFTLFCQCFTDYTKQGTVMDIGWIWASLWLAARNSRGFARYSST